MPSPENVWHSQETREIQNAEFIHIYIKKKNRQEKEKPHNQLFDKAPNQSARLKVMNMQLDLSKPQWQIITHACCSFLRLCKTLGSTSQASRLRNGINHSAFAICHRAAKQTLLMELFCVSSFRFLTELLHMGLASKCKVLSPTALPSLFSLLKFPFSCTSLIYPGSK